LMTLEEVLQYILSVSFGHGDTLVAVACVLWPPLPSASLSSCLDSISSDLTSSSSSPSVPSTFLLISDWSAVLILQSSSHLLLYSLPLSSHVFWTR
jgi:hypothetical protein